MYVNEVPIFINIVVVAPYGLFPVHTSTRCEAIMPLHNCRPTGSVSD